MLPIDVTSDIGEETERGWKQKNIVKNNNCSKARSSGGTVDKSIKEITLNFKKQVSLNIALLV